MLSRHEGNDLTCNSSGIARPQSSKLAEPLLTDPWPKRVELVRLSWSPVIRKAQMENDSPLMQGKHHTPNVAEIQKHYCKEVTFSHRSILHSEKPLRSSTGNAKEVLFSNDYCLKIVTRPIFVFSSNQQIKPATHHHLWMTCAISCIAKFSLNTRTRLLPGHHHRHKMSVFKQLKQCRTPKTSKAAFYGTKKHEIPVLENPPSDGTKTRKSWN